MTIRGGGNPHRAMAAMPRREWTRRLGALPAEAYDCFMVGPHRTTEYKLVTRLFAHKGRLPSDHHQSSRTRSPQQAAVLGPVKEWPGSSGVLGKVGVTAILTGPSATAS